MKLSFIGLGQMGEGMALNLSKKSGCEVVPHDIRDSMFGDFDAIGVPATLDVKKTWDSDIIFMCLPGTKDVMDEVLGEDGLIEHMKPGSILVDSSTIAIPETLQLEEALAKKGIEFLDAPVSGRQVRSLAGTLTIMIGGKKEIFEKVKPYFDMMGTEIFYMGPCSSGQKTKMINNCIYDINAAAFFELLTLGTKIGLDPEQLTKVVNTGTGQSGASQFFGPNILKGDFYYGYTAGAAYKDVASAVSQATLNFMPTPILDALNSVYKSILAKGYGGEYKGVMIRFYEEIMGIRSRQKGYEDKA